MSDDKRDGKKTTGGFFETIYHPPGCGHTEEEHEGRDGNADGSSSRTPPVTREYRDNYDRIFGGKKIPTGHA